MQKRFTKSAHVLDEAGRPNPGWSSKGLLHYHRKNIKAMPWRIKEWDWYQVSNRRYALQFTLGHASYAGQVGIMLFDFKTGKNIFVKDKILVLPFNSLKLGASAQDNGVVEYNKRGMFMRFENCRGIRTLTAKCRGFEATVTLLPLTPHALVINVPFHEHPNAFYYNHKVSCLKAYAKVSVNGEEYIFDNDAWGLLDWGRGVWPFHNEWYWSSCSGYLNGDVIGFNLGCGFGDTSNATENCVFYKDDIYKLGTVKIKPGPTYMEPWHLYDSDGRLDLTLTPTYDRETKTKLLWVDNNTHQMFGEFKGHIILDNNTKLDIDGLTGFAEHAVNNW